jgi:hypothetical protein
VTMQDAKRRATRQTLHLRPSFKREESLFSTSTTRNITLHLRQGQPLPVLDMAIASRWLRVPRPRVRHTTPPNLTELSMKDLTQTQTFLYIMSLRTGTEMISLSMIFNKITGFYGLLAILTGFSLSPLQLCMYLYSLAAVILLAFLMPHIRKQTPFQCLALAWFYLVDTIINTVFTAAFAVTWILTISADTTHTESPGSVAGSGTIDDTAAMVNRRYIMDEAITNPVAPGEDVVAAVTSAAATAAAGSTSLGDAVGIEETIPSIILVVLITLVRVYFILVVMAFARQVLRQHMYSSSTTQKTQFRIDGTVDVPASNPFAVGRSAGQGWRGKLGRLMVSIGEGYWLGGQADDDWAKGMDGHFRSRRTPAGPPGTVERERRARSGTGPPLPSPSVLKS